MRYNHTPQTCSCGTFRPNQDAGILHCSLLHGKDHLNTAAEQTAFGIMQHAVGMTSDAVTHQSTGACSDIAEFGKQHDHALQLTAASNTRWHQAC